MGIYLLVFCYWGVATFIVNQNKNLKKNRNNKAYFFIGGISLLFLMSFRSFDVGTDIISYYNEFQNAEYFWFNSLRSTEKIFSFINYSFQSLGFSFRTFLSLISLLMIAAISNLYYSFSKNIMLSYFLHVTIGMFSLSMTGLRQTIAVSLTLYAFLLLVKEKKMYFFLLIAIASFIHNSALVFIIVYFIRNIQLTKKRGFIIYFVSCITFFCKDFIAEFVKGLSFSKYTKYLESSNEVYVNPAVIIVAMLIPLVCLVVYQFSKDQKIMSLLFTLSCANFVIYFFATEISMFERLSYYFITYNTILIPNVIESIKEKEVKGIAMLLCIVLPLCQFLISNNGGSLGIDNFKFMWE